MTALGFWAIVPIFALIIGGPVYLVVGTPILLWRLRRPLHQAGDLVILAVASAAVLVVVSMVYTGVTGTPDAAVAIVNFGLFALVFAGLWAAAFGWLYIKMRRELYAHPVPV